MQSSDESGRQLSCVPADHSSTACLLTSVPLPFLLSFVTKVIPGSETWNLLYSCMAPSNLFIFFNQAEQNREDKKQDSPAILFHNQQSFPYKLRVGA